MLSNFTALPLVPSFKNGVSLGNAYNAAWDEISDVVASVYPPNYGYAWAIDDGIGTPAKFLAMRLSDGSSQGELTITSSTSVDAEAVATARVSGVHYLWYGDIGDNAAARASIKIYRVIEPTITGSNQSVAIDQTITCTYPNPPAGEGGGNARDAESMFADPATGDIYIITKRTTIPQVFMLPFQATYTGTQVLTSLGNMYALPLTSQSSGPANGGRAVGACITPNGREIMVKNYIDIYRFLRSPGQSIYQALTNTPTQLLGYARGGYPSSTPNNEAQGEAITADYTGTNLYTLSEYVALSNAGIPNTVSMNFYERVSKEATVISFQDGAFPTAGYASTLDTYIWSLVAERGTVRGTETTFIGDYDSAVSERYGLLKFDISTVPSNAVVLFCNLYIYINTEGALFDIYKMYMTWNESTTFNTLGRLPLFNNVDAASVPDATHGDYTGLTGPMIIKIPISTIQNWINGSVVNQGWVFHNIGTGGNGFQWRSRQFATATDRPRLEIGYITP